MGRWQPYGSGDASSYPFQEPKWSEINTGGHLQRHLPAFAGGGLTTGFGPGAAAGKGEPGGEAESGRANELVVHRLTASRGGAQLVRTCAGGCPGTGGARAPQFNVVDRLEELGIDGTGGVIVRALLRYEQNLCYQRKNELSRPNSASGYSVCT